MKYCTKCGSPITGNYCPNCGASKGGTESTTNTVHATSNANPVHTNPTANTQYKTNTESAVVDKSQYKLGWHKFLIYFVLWFQAILFALNAIQNFSVVSYSSAIALVAICQLVLAVYAIYVRFQLAGFKTGAPKKLLIFYLALLIVNVLVVIIVATSPYFELSPTVTSTLIANIAICVVSWRYYSSREELFIN